METTAYSHPRLSPDGKRLAVTGASINGQDVFILDLESGKPSRLTFDPANDRNPVWTPDGERIAYFSNGEEPGLFWRAANGTGQAERLTTTQSYQAAKSFSPDGTQLIYLNYPSGIISDIHVLSLADERTSQPLLQTEITEFDPRISPDGRWIAYVSNETGRNEVYVRPYPDVDDGKWQISTDGGEEPLWHPGGRELFFTIRQRMVVSRFM